MIKLRSDEPPGVNAFDRAFDQFAKAGVEVWKYVEAVEKTNEAIKLEETAQALLDLIKKAGPNGDLEWYKREHLEKAKVEVNTMVTQLATMESLSSNDGSKNPCAGTPASQRCHIVERARQVTELACQFKEGIEKISETISSIMEDGETTLFTSDSKADIYNGERGELTIQIFPASDTKKEHPVYRMDFVLPPTGKAFLDVSTGVFMSNLHDETYRLDGGVIRSRGETDDLQPSFGALLHYGRQLETLGAGAISMGLALSGEKYRFFIGGSFAPGKSRRFYISGGLALASVKRLKGYNAGDQFGGKESDIPTDGYYKAGAFFGLSYKL